MMAPSLPLLSALTSGACGRRRMSLCSSECCCAPVPCMHYSIACASERNWSARGQLFTKHCSRLAPGRARKVTYVT
eukprot:1158076-Pelagomonas_calceolata.AAC.10